MRLPFRRAMLAVVLGLGVLAGLVRADEHHGSGPVQAGGHHEPAYYWHAYTYQPQALLTSPHPHAKYFPGLHRTTAHPWCCWAHHNDYTTGSLKSNLIFIFGSSRTFFGEPCRKGPPPFPID